MSMHVNRSRQSSPRGTSLLLTARAPRAQAAPIDTIRADDARGIGCDFTTVPGRVAIQRKARVTSPGDAHEREADDVADTVMRMREPAPIGAAPISIQRACAACADEDKDKAIHAKHADAARDETSMDTHEAVQAAANSGAPLPHDARAYLEPRFGRDFSNVRVHADGVAASAARSINARAYTIGRDIVFGAGEFAPSSAQGQRLLAHELTHVVQQSGASMMQNSAGYAVQRKDDRKPKADKEPTKEKPKDKPDQTKVMTNCAKDYTVESWEKDTCCLNRGFVDAGASSKKAGVECCNTFPAFVDDAAVALGFDGAASCRKRQFLNHRARVTPAGKTSSVDVLCVDTRANKSAHFIELGFKAAQKAYGSNSVLDKNATVCIGDAEEAKTCGLVTDCNKTVKPKESQCLPTDCSKTAPATEKKEAPAK
jgi:hypothetical protein